MPRAVFLFCFFCKERAAPLGGGGSLDCCLAFGPKVVATGNGFVDDVQDNLANFGSTDTRFKSGGYKVGEHFVVRLRTFP